MGLVNTRSLAKTIDRVNESLFFGQSISRKEKEEVAQWIASRQGLQDSYANMFAPTKHDFREGIRVFTGERITSSAALRHILGEEACRALMQLNVSKVSVKDALKRANKGMKGRLKQSERWFYKSGMYCCGTCTVSLWRHLIVGGLDNAERRLTVGMKALKKYRDGFGKWRRFPLYYTLLALSEVDLASARAEMKYAAKVLERFLKRSQKKTKINQRRRVLAEGILARI
ncbi:MAG: hypothetical protein E3J87_06870 [Candidatus Cloacimonadota bacterium]|nr:MAG: hypothetical protein E3J87_06870 [Candidatus Cloacimonadota bacterium]